MGKALPGETWRKLSFDVPEDVRVLVEYALELAALCGARSRVEAMEFVSVSFIQSCEQENAEWNARVTTPEARFRLDVLTRDGWRCCLCNTSRNLTVHHITPRSECRASGRLDLLTDPANGATLCAACHSLVQPRWRSYVEELSK